MSELDIEATKQSRMIHLVSPTMLIIIKHVCFRLITSLHIVFGVIYYLELRSALTVYCMCFFNPKKDKLVVWTL